jgi:YVTN family beta-propeller protein
MRRRTFNAAATLHAIHIVNQGAGMLSVIDPRTHHLLTSVPTGNSPYGVAVAPSGPGRWTPPRKARSAPYLIRSINFTPGLQRFTSTDLTRVAPVRARRTLQLNPAERHPRACRV